MQSLEHLNTPKKAEGTLTPFTPKRIIYTEPVYKQGGKWYKVSDLNKKKRGKK